MSKKLDSYSAEPIPESSRALVTFEKLGVIEKYNKMFDLNLYYKNKDNYLKKLQKSKQLNDINLLNFLGKINDNDE